MALGSRDVDGDSEMASSVSSPHSEPDAVDSGARTPTHHTQPTAPASELSPPGSQPQQRAGGSSTADSKPDTETEATRNLGKTSDAPVAAWKSKRAQEEYYRAMEQVIDKDFSLNEFGDPFDERDLEMKLR